MTSNTSGPSRTTGPNTAEMVGHHHEENAANGLGAHPDLAPHPRRRVAIVACMDARIDVPALFGLAPGDAHIIRNAGGVVTDDTIRSLCLSQRELGTTEIILIHHTRCGLAGLDEAGFVADVVADTGIRPPWAVRSFDDPVLDTAHAIRALRSSPFLLHSDAISGYVLDIDTGELVAVDVEQTR